MLRYYTILLGLALLAAGIGGFIPGITHPPHTDMPPLSLDTSYGLLLGLFPINIIHNLIHLSLGIWGILAYRSAAQSLLYLRAMTVILGAFTLMGLLPGLSTTFGILPLYGHAIWLHGLEATIAFYLGWLRPLITKEVSYATE